MKLVDANVLLYAANSDARHHARSLRWLDDALSGADTVGFAWVVTLAFLRLSTKPGVFASPLSVEEATTQVESWLSAPGARVVEPQPTHAQALARLLRPIGTGGNLVTDAHIAALALDHRATVVTFDNDFDRFAGVRWESPPPVDV